MSALTLSAFQDLKGKRKISMVTCYDAPSARLVDKSDIDIILVGDSVAMTVHGFSSTIHATMDMMIFHLQAVRRGSKDKFVVADLPFLIHRLGREKTVYEAGRLLQAGADAIKIEGVHGHEEVISYLIGSGIPVMGHTGLTPQSVASLGGWKVQGKTHESAAQIRKEAQVLQSLGCFSLVLECVPAGLAKTITEELSIPTIGIGAGADTDGQVLVWHDLLGLNLEFKPKFVRQFCQVEPMILQTLNDYHNSVVSQNFPNKDEQYD